MSFKENNNGLVQISDAVLVSIVQTATMETEGVHSISSSLAQDIIGKLKKSYKGIVINKQDNKLIINIDICIKQNYKILDITKTVQEKVKSAVEEMTGLKIEKINVNVVSVELNKPKK